MAVVGNSFVALVTGVQCRLGREFAKQLAAEGLHVLVVADTPGGALSAAEALRSYGLKVEALDLDIGTAASPTSAEALTQCPVNRVDILVDNVELLSSDPGDRELGAQWRAAMVDRLERTESLVAACSKALAAAPWSRALTVFWRRAVTPPSGCDGNVVGRDEAEQSNATRRVGPLTSTLRRVDVQVGGIRGEYIDVGTVWDDGNDGAAVSKVVSRVIGALLLEEGVVSGQLLYLGQPVT